MANSTPKILIGICSSIAAYKIADLVSLFKKEGFEVRCVMTTNASQLVSPLVLETLSGHPVGQSVFGPGTHGTDHIEWARWCDLILIAPASANTIAKAALGIADDLVSTVMLATRAPLMIAPAMNTAMWDHPAVQQNIKTLQNRQTLVIEPTIGTLACGEIGIGKMADLETILKAVKQKLGHQTAPLHDSNYWTGKRVLITAGPTVSHLDAVRYMTNGSTGQMGQALAHSLLERGASVDYILGVDKGVVEPKILPKDQSRYQIKYVKTAQEMLAQALAWGKDADHFFSTAAVLDYQVKRPAVQKQKRSNAPLSLELIPSVDVLASIKVKYPHLKTLGFAAETEHLLKYGKSKLQNKKLDAVFVNPVAQLGQDLQTGFGAPTNSGFLIWNHKGKTKQTQWGVTSKTKLASLIVEQLSQIWT